MDKYCGIDLHSNNSVVVVTDEADRVLYQRRLPNDPIQIRGALATHREHLVGVVIEATFYGRPGIMHALPLTGAQRAAWVPIYIELWTVPRAHLSS